MGLLVKKETIEIQVCYEEKDGRLAFFEEGKPRPSEAKTETFIFRKPNWGDIRKIMSSAAKTSPDGQTITIDFYAMADARVKQLLESWSIKGDNGEALPPTAENVDGLAPNLVQYVIKLLADKIPPLEQ